MWGESGKPAELREGGREGLKGGLVNAVCVLGGKQMERNKK